MALKRKPPPGNVRRTISLGGNFRGVTTNKRGHLVQFESEQERKLVLLLERDPTVADYRSQPEVLHFTDASGRPHRYTPDFQIWRTTGLIELHEVTVAARRESHPSLLEREAAARAICNERGWRYVVHSDQTLPAAFEYRNLDFLSAFRSQIHAAPEPIAWWLVQLKGQERVSPQKLLTNCRPSLTGPVLNTLYHLLWHGVIQMDWHQPLLWRGDFHPGARVWLEPQSQAVRPPRIGCAEGGAE
jgi:hypothetical protein